MHIISKSSTELAVIANESIVLLIEDGVYYINNLLQLKEKKLKVYAIEQDVIARGISVVDKYVELIDYEKFVDLTVKNEKILSW